MSLNIEHLKSEIIIIANKIGIIKFDVFGSSKEESSASSKNKKPFSLNSAIKSSILIRVWNSQNQVGVTSTSNLTKDGLEEALKLANSSAIFNSQENSYDFSAECLSQIEENHSETVPQSLTTMQELVEKAVYAETTILNFDSVFTSVPYNKISETLSLKFYFNSIGSFRSENKNISFCYFYPLAQVAEKLPRQSGEISIANSIKNLDVNACIEKAINKTKNHLNYINIKSGKYEVAFAPEAFLDIINSFSNFINAQNILDKKSLSNIESIGTQVASEAFTLYDSPLHPLNPGKTLFDEEGTPTKELEIIKDGFLKNFLHSSHTAKIMKTKLTGHAHIGAKITVSPHFLCVKSVTAQQQPERSLNTSENIVYIESVKSLHAGINALQGSFSLPFDGFLVNHGKMESIESATIAGDFLTLLKNISFISNKEEVTASGICPEIWITELSITGNA